MKTITLSQTDKVPSLDLGALQADPGLKSTGLCTGCAFLRAPEDADGPCALPRARRNCVEFTSAGRMDYVYIRRTPKARAAYAALVLQYGQQGARP